MPGHMIFLNGTSSAGKTTLAHALQERLSKPYLHVALDQFRDGLPDKFRGLNAPADTAGSSGLNVVPQRDCRGNYTLIKFGESGLTMLRGMRRAMLALVQAGNNIIVDDIILEADFLDDYLTLFEGLPVTFVGVRCPLDVIDKREKARPGRFPGTAFGHHEVCHAHGDYDVEVDTSQLSPGECADKVISVLNQCGDTAFSRLLTSS